MKKLIGIAIITALFLAGCNLFPGEDDYNRGVGYKINFDLNGAESFVETPNSKYLGLGRTIKLPSGNNFIRYEHSFRGWYETDPDTASFSFTMPEEAPDGNIQLKAAWTEMTVPTSVDIPEDLLKEEEFNIYDEDKFKEHIFAYYNGTYYVARPEPEGGDTAENWKHAAETVSSYGLPENNGTVSWKGDDNTWTLNQSSWRLPDIRFLGLMHKNLHSETKGNFSDSERYWSSVRSFTGSDGYSYYDTRYFKDNVDNNDFYEPKREKTELFFRPYISFKVTGQ